MGGASSKVSRKLPSKPTTPWAGARTDRSVQPQPPRNALASETKNASIEKDAGDPHFMQNLNKLGPVKVDHHMSTFRADTNMRNVLKSRENSEQQAASHAPPKNRILASALFDALEQRKLARSTVEMAKLASQYNLDVDVLERVARYANTPSTVEGSRRKVVDEEGSERFTILAAWEGRTSENNSNNLTKRA